MKLNKAEVWIAEHSIRIFLVVAVLLIAGAVAVFVTLLEAGDAKREVNVLRPQVTRINKAVCDKRSLEAQGHAQACAERIRIGLVNCRRAPRCRQALLAAIAAPSPEPASPPAPTSPSSAPATGGGEAQNPHEAGQQPKPPKAPSHGGDGTNGNAGAQPPASSPGTASPAGGESSSAGEGGSAQGEDEQQGEGEGDQGGSSGAGVEVCTSLTGCLGVEAELPQPSKGGNR